MYGILISAGSLLLENLVKTLIGKVVLSLLIYGILSVVLPHLLSLVPAVGPIVSQLTNVDPKIAYWLNFFRFPTGFAMIVSAYFTRFIIRRLPLVG